MEEKFFSVRLILLATSIILTVLLVDIGNESINPAKRSLPGMVVYHVRAIFMMFIFTLTTSIRNTFATHLVIEVALVCCSSESA